MPDAIAALSSEYIYISDRLAADIVDQVAAARTKRRLGAIQIRPPFLSIETRDRNLGTNRFAMAAEATDAVADLTGSFAYPGPFVRGRAKVSWWDLKTDVGQYRVAWLVAEQTGDEGRYLLSLCGSLQHYIGYDAKGTKVRGWRPSAVEGMHNIVAAYHGRPRRFDPAPPEDDETVRFLIGEATHISLVMDEASDHPIGSSRMEVLAREWYRMSGPLRVHNYRTGEHEQFDGLSVGTPLWVRTIPDAHPIGPSHGDVRLLRSARKP
jgi:hypothetical protein